jgi:cytochrome c oxidase cbb3-type subunit 3
MPAAANAVLMVCIRAAAWVTAAAALAACQPQDGDATTVAARGLPTAGRLASLPTGDIAGAVESTAPESIKNPYERDKTAIAEGRRLFIAMNCAGCHGYDATGGMGPDLTDKFWRYGGTPAAIYQSVFEGRPQGMPAWGRALPPQEIWKIVAYVETLGGSLAPSLYHAGLQGDHDLTSTAPEVRDLGSLFDQPRSAAPEQAAVPGGAQGQAPELAKPGTPPDNASTLPASRPNAESAAAPQVQKGGGGIGPNSVPPGPASPGSAASKPAADTSPTNSRGAQ